MSTMDSVMAFLQSLQGLPAYGLLFGALAASGFGLPINEDLLLLVAAALTLRGVMEPVPLIAVAWCGLLTADALVFHWGHRFGAPLLRHRAARRVLPAARLAALQERMRRWGPASIFAVRFMPGMRTALFFAAGRWQDILAGVQRFEAVLIPAGVRLATSALVLYLWRRRPHPPRQ